MLSIRVTHKDIGERLDRFLQKELKDFSRTEIQKLIQNDLVLLDGKALVKNFKIIPDIEIQVLELPVQESSHLEAENIPLNIVYEDEDMAVINKPKGMVVHPGSGVQKGTLASALLYHFQNNLSLINGPFRPGIVHRLDKDTAGIMLVAKNDYSHRFIAEQLEKRTLKRTYKAIVWGHPRDLEATISAPIIRDSKNRLKMMVDDSGKEAISHYRVLELFSFASFIEFSLETGRTHQIRLHSRYIGNPIIGDPIYEGRETSLTRIPVLMREVAQNALNLAPSQILQAVELSLIHPNTKKQMDFKIPLEENFENLLSFLRKESPSDLPSFSQSFFKTYESDRRFEIPEEDTNIEEAYEAPPIKTRLTRAERLQKKKERIARKKEIELEKLQKKEEKRALSKGEKPEEIVAPGFEPTIDPNLLK